jgi:uncharacterized glyoxalase superfamily protein PhnB
MELHLKKLTPVIFVDAIEPCLPFWTDRLGFEVTVTVPHGDQLGFAILQRGGVEIMYQTRASLSDDLPSLMDDARTGGCSLFIEVESVDEIERALKGVEPLVPRRQTFYGMDELLVRGPCGSVLCFAAQVEKAATHS